MRQQQLTIVTPVSASRVLAPAAAEEGRYAWEQLLPRVRVRTGDHLISVRERTEQDHEVESITMHRQYSTSYDMIE